MFNHLHAWRRRRARAREECMRAVHGESFTRTPLDIDPMDLCERCRANEATMLLGKGLLVCVGCYQDPEDVVAQL